MPREEKNCIASGSKHFNMGVFKDTLKLEVPEVVAWCKYHK